MTDPTLYLFDGSNLFHAGGFRHRDELVDALAGFAAVRGARAVVVFDGVGERRQVGSLEVRFAPHADTVLERLAADARSREVVVLVTSDIALRATAGQEVRKRGSLEFLTELATADHREDAASRIDERLDPDTRARLERLRRGQS